ncbi:MAG: hypothetical protein A3F72_20895 [Bacteroidetes bacterium RIFCSPLOWO2_12_FULL_35_15]|nr:MAG: hypothetical protein A3F72_20895 [Bacteroidetes bacterium RIFCSPLOWO2_12_FULL_35_15]
MKKNVLSILLLSSSLFCNTAFAQLSQGGKPISFEKHFQTTATIKFENLPTVDVAALKAEDAINDQNKGPFRFGFNHFVNYNLSNSGTWTTLTNGDRLWQLGIKSKDAISMNLAFDDFYLPVGAKLFIYTADKKFVIGAFTSKNNDASRMFATDLLPGEAIVIEYYEPTAVANPGRLNLFRVTHGYRGVVEYAQKSFGDAGACQVNVNCPVGTAWQNEKHGVVCLVVGGSEFCTGSLVNDVPLDGKPYVLTANHCSSSNDFATWVFRFNWEAPGCSDPAGSPSSQTLNASTLRARNAGSDFCLVEITGGLSSGTVPQTYAPYFNGWSNVNIPADSVVCIHHPSGDIKKISEALNPTTTASWGTPAADTWQVGEWTTACTEPGSSGAPLFDQNHRIVGQLYGGPSACGVAPADNHDNYGKFSTSWLGGGTSATQLKVWLDPGNTGATTVDGYDPYALPPAFAFDAGVQSINNPANGLATCNTSITPQLVIHNYGSATLTTCTINYQLDGGSVQTLPWTGSLNTYQSTTISLPALTGLSVGSHTFTSYTTNPNGSTEQNTVNDSTTSTFSIITASPVATIPQTENFQATFPSTNFSIGNPDANETWVQFTGAGGFGTSSTCAQMDNNINTDISDQSDFIYTPYLDLSSVTGPVKITFDVAYARYSNVYYDSLLLKTSNDCGSSWNRVYAKGGTSLATAPNNNGAFVPTASQWRTDTVDLSSYIGQSAVRIAFENKSGWGQALYIDNINISNTTSIYTNDFNSSFSIYPNPSKGEMSVNVNLQTAQNVTIKIINILGKVISTRTLSNISSGIFNLDLSTEAQGMYFVELSTDKEKTVKKITILK